ncbi:hypothetical protein B0T26DRAFT_723995 [Lasiosphaeria miniovina]|uniref:PAN-3 domain-containing protein n=1 Tax=Lasiosphaeria miniovina TaxID=1954250 RepID=A0AA40DR06_9PEZI|nr:uncharacterized protein B0T26DRAFT_723995 [Lasiosphaeria miniovina]KAK0710077.1 hypothetical protein B0T26DRAFT_723995 [Lasiosphaeria miniovina]
MLNDGDGDLGLAKGTFLNMASCIDACAQQTKCVAVVFNSTPSCYLKEFVYYKTATVGYEYAVLQT